MTLSLAPFRCTDHADPWSLEGERTVKVKDNSFSTLDSSKPCDQLPHVCTKTFPTHALFLNMTLTFPTESKYYHLLCCGKTLGKMG